jgi:phosphatidylglycerophosphatase C
MNAIPSVDEFPGSPPRELSRIDSRAPLAVFDLDGTLTVRDTFLPFLVSFARRYRRVVPLLSLPIPLALYAARLMKDSAAKERLLVSFLAGQPMERIDEHADWFCRKWLPRRLNAAVVRELQRHQKSGDRVIVLSASPSVYVPAVCRSLGVDEVVCTQVAVADGRCLGRLSGPNCKGAAKLKLLQDYLATSVPDAASVRDASPECAPEGSFAYGDSRHDLPVLGWVANGRLVRRGRIVAVGGAEEHVR